MLKRLRTMEAPLRDKGVIALWIFGSAARDDAWPDSDLDRAVEFAPGAALQSSTFHLKDDLETALGQAVELGERATILTVSASV